MERFSFLKCVFFLMVFLLLANRIQGDGFKGPLNKTGGLCAKYVLSVDSTYTCEEYEVQTFDGFILGVQRMFKGNSSTNLKPVFLLHGVLSAGDSWFLLNSPSHCLPFMLGEAGYDVWIGNSRTSNFGGDHVTLKRSQKDFWNWSVDEMSSYDLPAMMEAIASKTTIPIHYIGYSQGGQIALAAFSEGLTTSLLDKVVFLAPAAYVNSLPTTLSIGSDLYIVDDMLNTGTYEYSLQTNTDLMAKVCAVSIDANCISETVATITGPNCCVDDNTMSSYDAHSESTSTKNMVHFAQQHRTKSFAKYDYGMSENLSIYKSSSPPSYQMSAIPSIPLLVIHGGNDALVDTSDTSLLLEKLSFTPNVLLLDSYGHLDFILGSTVSVDCYSKVLDFLA